MQARLFCFLFLFSFSASISANVELIKSYQQLAESGAAQLALEELRGNAPNIVDDPLEWSNWQWQELTILAKQQWWQQLLDQIEAYPVTAPAAFIAAIQEFRIEALIELGRFHEARKLLIKQIWRGGERASDHHKLKRWRELITKSYISEGVRDDAHIAMKHFRDDYTVADEKPNRPLIENLLASNHPGIAEEVIDKLPNSYEKRLLKQLAQLRQQKGVKSIDTFSRKQLKKKGLLSSQRSILWGMTAEAAKMLDDKASRIRALESLLKEKRSKKIDKLFLNLDTVQLWSAYDDYAQSIGKREQLRSCDDDAWLESAKKAAKRAPIHQRSIYAYLSRHSVSETRRLAIQNLFLSKLKKSKKGRKLITRLYTDNSASLKSHQIERGAELLAIMLNDAFKTRDFERAHELLLRIDHPESGTGYFSWALRKAKVLLLMGNYPQSIEEIEALIDELPNTTEKYRDRLIQLIFDLQTAHQDIAAVRLLKKIDEQSGDAKLHRELLFWIADSNMTLKKYQLAARGYLESATVFGVKKMDPWAQTARYQAANALLKAGLKSDAKAIYKHLLKHTHNLSRRLILKQEMEKIYLHQESDD